MVKVCYFTSKSASDVRVFEKECTSLVKFGYEVYLISPNAKEEIKNGVKIMGIPYNKKGIFNRLFILPWLLYKKALTTNADIYHFNDPASLHYVTKLKRKGKKVIFDSFEDHPTLFFEKHTLPYIIRYIISKIYSIYEFYKCKKIDGLISCYHWTQERLNKACRNNQLVFNFPILKANAIDKHNINNNVICYTGLISNIWNIEKIINSISNIENIQFNLAGNPADGLYLKKLTYNNNWQKVNFLGQIKHEDLKDKVFSKSNIAMALLDYIPLCKGNIGNMSNNKLFEYMLAGLPVICTDFILWKQVIEENNCGICVNPNDVSSITDAINYLVNNPETAKQMGKNGQRMVETKYNWSYEEIKLNKLYASL